MTNHKPPSCLTSADSGTVVVRSAGSILRNELINPFLVSTFQKIGAQICNIFPPGTRRKLMEFASESIGVNPDEANHIKTSELVKWVTSEYPSRQYETIIIGSPSGGIGHLASLMNAPFLTQHFLLGFKGQYPIDCSSIYRDKCKPLANQIIDNNPDLSAIIHYDPLHDRFVVRRVGFIRVKLLEFHGEYIKFISENLKAGGNLILVGCSFPWLQYKLSDRINFQLGGLGGVTDQEYYDGSDRIEKYIKTERDFPERKHPLSHKDWLLEGLTPEKQPESEWGLIESFADDVRNLAQMKKYNLVEIKLQHPDQLSKMVFYAFKDLISYEKSDISPTIVMDSFTNSSPLFNRTISAIPLWLPFICSDSYDFAVSILDNEPENTRIFLSLHPSFANPFDLTPLYKWSTYLSRFREVILLGVNPSKYPGDLTSYFRFYESIRRFSGQYQNPITGILNADQLIPYIDKYCSAGE
jgi:hypothetical protein